MSDDTRKFAHALLAKVFTPAALAPCDWRHGDVRFERVEGDYFRIWSSLPGGHKKYSYFALYEKLFSGLRGRSPKVLEIGVYKGASLKTWSAYLGPGATIVGVDINEECRGFDEPDAGRHVRIGSQADPDFMAAVAQEFGPFDAVIDDGSHVTTHQVASFRTLFPDHVKRGGLYFIEDTNTSLWANYRRGGVDIFDLIAGAAMATHYFYAEYGYHDYKHEAHPRAYPTPRIATEIEEVRVFDSAIAIYRAGPNYHPPLVRHT